MDKNTNRCLYCYEPLNNGEQDFHGTCSKKFFGDAIIPELPFGLKQIEELAKEVIIRSIAVTGVQPKLSLDLEKGTNANHGSRFTIVGMMGHFILKPPTAVFPFLPEIEDLTMHLASIAKIKTAEHSLIRLQSGELAYITKRFDRNKKSKLALEDMCQLTETLTEDKYRGSMEKVGKAIRIFSSNPGIDVISFFELTLFSFLTGNADMHLKNFSLLTGKNNEISFSPAYDLVATKLLMPQDIEELALTLNGKKIKFKRNDFDLFAEKLLIPTKASENVYEHLNSAIPKMLACIDISFLNEELKENYKELIQERSNRVLI